MSSKWPETTWRRGPNSIPAAEPADVPSTWADISKAERLLRWRPEVMLEKGLSRTVSWYLKNRDLTKKMCELSD